MSKISPMIPSTDLGEISDFMEKNLGFSTVMETPEYVIISKEGNDLHIIPSHSDNPNQLSVYFEVENLDKVWSSFQDFCDEEVKVRPPFDQAYGMREFHVILPRTNCLLFVGQIIV